MKYILTFILFLIFNFSYSQTVDTIIKTKWYTSYYSYSLKSPQYVIYPIYKGGGECDRSSEKFKTGGLKNTAKAKDYAKSGFDQGHLVPYEDLAYDCKAAESTFRFFNVLPQTPNLNRGEWKKWEFIIREVSKNDSLLVITGGSKWNKFIGDSVWVPDLCWKVVWSKSKKVVLYALIFENKKSGGKVSTETITTLEKKIKINIRQYFIF